MILKEKKAEEGNFGLELYLDQQVFLEICLFNENGQLVYNFCQFVEKGAFNHELATETLPGGIYLLRVAQNGTTTSHKIINL